MPLPAVSERAASVVASELRRFDRNLTAYLVQGGSPPATDRVFARIEIAVRSAVVAALREVEPAVTTRMVEAAVREVMTPIRARLAAALRTARRVRRQMPRRPPRDDDGDSAAVLVRRLGAAAAFSVLLTRLRRRRTDMDAVRRTASTAGVVTPPLTAGYGRMVVRTKVTEVRADIAANRAEREGLVLLITDARSGPTDERCHDVNGRYATPLWVRRHRLEHPNCTRLAMPTKLPAGRRVTLLR